ncbi:MAG: ABC transporter permease [Verrucomicrobia bacterium]|nr:ABC transporter permease [Verrucomicrobiota bacterium]
MSADIDPRARSVALRPTFWGAFRGLWLLAWRTQLSLRRLPLVLASLGLIPILAYATVEDEATRPFFHWTVEFYFLLGLPLYCLSVCGAMIRDELQSDTLGFLSTRPMTRARLFLGKFLCNFIWLQGLALLCGLLMVAVGWTRAISGITAFALIFLAAQFLAVLSYGALSSLLGLIHQRYMVLGFIYGFVVEVGIGQIPTNINNLSLSRHLRTILGNDRTIQDLYEWTPDRTLFSVAAMLAASALFLAAGAVLFTFREYHQSEEMQK